MKQYYFSFIILLAVLMAVGAGCGSGSDTNANNHSSATPAGQQMLPPTDGSSVAPGQQPLPPTGNQPLPPVGQHGSQQQTVSIQEILSEYPVYQESDGSLQSLQNASLFLSTKGYNKTGGPLLFNHPGAVASDGERFFLADRNNNRVLVWNSIPGENQEPDLVLGQDNFNTNNPGTDLNRMNWPMSIAAVDGKLFVTDAYNDRVLVWNSMPTRSGQAADFALETNATDRGAVGSIGWPWDVWSNGEKLVVTSTGASQVLIWNSLPQSGDTAADVSLTYDGFGTPRSIASDGNSLAISDHNAQDGKPGTYFWNSFPTSGDSQPDFFVQSPSLMGAGEQEQSIDGLPPVSQESHGNGELAWMNTSEDGALYMLAGLNLYYWEHFPQSANDTADAVWGDETGYAFKAGDGSGVTVAGDKLYLSLSNGNKIVYFDSLPTNQADGTPSGVIGGPDLETNTLDTNYIMSNPVPATDGNGLIVSSDFDKKLYVWRNVPDQIAHPDYVYSLPEAPWDSAWYDNTYVAAGKKAIYAWNEGLPTEGAMPSHSYYERIGSVQFNEIKGVAYNGTYLFVSDVRNNAVYVWEGLPGQDQEPIGTIQLEQPQRLSASNDYLMVSVVYGQEPIRILTMDQVRAGESGTAVRGVQYNLPEGVVISNEGKVAVADTIFNRVHIWNSVESALNGSAADVTLGTQETQTTPQIGESTLFWPSGIAMHGDTVWVGEFKFSERLLRFNP